MQKFTDAHGKQWHVAVTVKTVADCRRLLDLDLADTTGETFMQLQTDPVALVDVLFVVCMDEAAAANITDEDFGRLFNGDTLDAATRALLEALADFFPPHKRKALRAAWGRIREIEEMAIGRIETRIASDPIADKILADIDARMDRATGTAAEKPKPKRKRTSSKPATN